MMPVRTAVVVTASHISASRGPGPLKVPARNTFLEKFQTSLRLYFALLIIQETGRCHLGRYRVIIFPVISASEHSGANNHLAVTSVVITEEES